MTKNQMSYVHGVADQPLMGETIGAVLDRVTMEAPDQPALVVRHQNIRWTYREFHERVERLAAGLLALGFTRGDRLGIWSQNRVEWTLTQFATAKLGVVLVNINPAYRLSELEYALNKVGCSGLILSPSFKTSDYIGIVRSLAPELDQCAPGELRSTRLPELRTVIRMASESTPGMFNFDDLLDRGTPEHREEMRSNAELLQFDDPINIQFTSGTTGQPKGATLTHHNILNNGFFVGRGIKLSPDDRLCIPVPFYHCFGMVMGNIACVTHKACMVVPGEGFDASAVLATVAEERCTALHGVPTMFISLLDHPEFSRFDLGSLRTGIMAGSPCPVEVMKRVIAEMHMEEVTIAYGMTETSPVSFQSATDTPLHERVETVGQVAPHIEAKVVDEDGRIVPFGEKGELLVRGYSVMRGYWGDPERTAEAVDAGRWMHTGDLATIDKQGYCRIVGRIKDLIIRGGENVYPREVEEFLYTHPLVSDVQVIGVPDDRFGEEVCAWIVTKEGGSLTVDEIRSYCAGQIAHHKVPRYIRFVDGFPMTVTGKVQKFVMRDAMIAEFAAQKPA